MTEFDMNDSDDRQEAVAMAVKRADFHELGRFAQMISDETVRRDTIEMDCNGVPIKEVCAYEAANRIVATNPNGPDFDTVVSQLRNGKAFSTDITIYKRKD